MRFVPSDPSAANGLAGKGLLAKRPDDSFGLGYFYQDFSDDLQSAVNPAVQFEDEQGVEAYYNSVVRPWLIVAADLQCVSPGRASNDDAVIAGVRARFRF